jgi:hypothetical protein
VKLKKIKKRLRSDKQITGQYSSAPKCSGRVYMGALKVLVSFSKCLVSYRTTLTALRAVWVQLHSDWYMGTGDDRKQQLCIFHLLGRTEENYKI